jgi:hypothetical protein
MPDPTPDPTPVAPQPQGTPKLLLDPNDNGMMSRKYHIVLLTMAMICGGALLAAHWPAFAGSFPTLVGGLLAAAALYTGGNVAYKYVAGRSVAFGPAASDPDNGGGFAQGQDQGPSGASGEHMGPQVGEAIPPSR